MALKRFVRIALLWPLLLLVAAGAKAQTDGSVYGVLDWSYGRFEPSGLYREMRFNSNSLTASFVGVNVKHGFESGWTPGLTLETFVRLQDFQTGRNDRDPLFSRNAFVSLDSRYGTLRLGRLQTFLFDTTARFNALGNSLAFSPAMRHVFASGDLEGVQGDFYWDRAVSYQSPKLEGALENLRANLMYAGGGSDERGDYTGGSLIYAKGLFAAALSAQRVHVNDGIRDPTNETTWQIGASYIFGFAKLFGQFTKTNDQGLDVRSNISTIGAEFPLGPGQVLAQIGVTTAKGPAVDRKHTSTSVAYLYAYDSQTDFYVAAMDDRIRGQTRGASVAAGVRWRF
ncbi:MAG: porin [Ideonella sp.]